MREVLPRVGLKLKTSLRLRRVFPTNILPISLRLTRIQCLKLGPKSEELEIHQVRNLLVPSVVRSIGVNAWWEREIALAL